MALYSTGGESENLVKDACYIKRDGAGEINVTAVNLGTDNSVTFALVAAFGPDDTGEYRDFSVSTTLATSGSKSGKTAWVYREDGADAHNYKVTVLSVATDNPAPYRVYAESDDTPSVYSDH